MAKYSFYEKRSGKILFGFAFFFLLLLARDTLVTSCIVGFYPAQFISLGIMMLLGILFLIWNRGSIKEILHDRRTICIGAVSAIILLPMLVKQDWQLMYFSILLCLFFAVFLTYFITVAQTARYYVIMLSILAVYSLLAIYVLKPLADTGVLWARSFINSAGVPFYDFGLSYTVKAEAYYRNFGIFREPGVYQFFIIVALFLNNYTINWKRQWPMWLINIVFAATMFSTFSTNGVIELVLFAIVLFFDKKIYKNKCGLIITAVILIGAGIAVGEIVAQKGKVYWTLYSMFEKLFVLTDSSQSRLEAILADILVYLNAPVFGESIRDVLYAVRHNTTSTLVLFCILGTAGGGLSVASWIALVWEKKRSILTNILLLIILFMSFNTQNLTADVFFWLFPMMALIERGLPKLYSAQTGADN